MMTLRMIWNHSMPAHWQVGKVARRYSFPPIYSQVYLHEAILNISRELFTRKDLEPLWPQWLAEMEARFKNRLETSSIASTMIEREARRVA